MVKLIFLAIGLIALLLLGWQDLRAREITWSWLYVVILICGIFTEGNWIIKLICLIVIPLLLMECARLLVIIKAKRAAKKQGIPYERPKDILANALSYFGGADIKTIAVAGFMAGPYWLAVGLVVGVLLCSWPFIIKPTFGIKKSLLLNDSENMFQGKQPFCTLLSVGMVVVAVFILLISR